MAERPFSESPAAPEPSPAARELLRAFREHESPSAAERELGLAALRARVRAAEPAPAANGRIYTYAKAAVVTVAVAAAVLLAIKAVGSGVTALADRARQPAVEAPYQGEAGSDGGQAVARVPKVLPPRRNGAKAVDEREAMVHETEVIQTPPPSEPAPRPPRPRSVSPASSTSASASASADELRAELALIKRANQAKKDERHADGLAVLREHAERFPQGTFADERMVLRAELYCASGRTQQAHALVESFLREHAGSALAGRMRSVCRE